MTKTINHWRSQTTNIGSPHEQGLVWDDVTGKDIAVTYDPKNAPLVAAAPALYEALNAIREDLDLISNLPGDSSELQLMVDTALLKAEGKL